MNYKYLFLFDRPEPRHFSLYFLSLCAGGFITYSIFPSALAVGSDLSFDKVLILVCCLMAGPIFFYFGLSAWFPRILLITNDSISLSGSLVTFAGARLRERGQIQFPFSNGFRFNAKKDGWSKGISFHIQVPSPQGAWTDYRVLDHCSNPRRVAKKINMMIEKMGGEPHALHLSATLNKQFR